MTQPSTRPLGNIVLAVAVVLLIINICGLAGLIPKFIPPVPLNLLIFTLLLVSFSLRRGRRGPRP